MLSIKCPVNCDALPETFEPLLLSLGDINYIFNRHLANNETYQYWCLKNILDELMKPSTEGTISCTEVHPEHEHMFNVPSA